MSSAKQKNVTLENANKDREEYRAHLLDELSKLDLPDGSLTHNSKFSANPVRGLAHFQNASLQFAGALIAASLVGLANAGRVETTVRLAGREPFDVISHVLGFLVIGAVLVTITAAITQGQYSRLLEKYRDGQPVNLFWFWVFSALGAGLMALAGVPFIVSIAGLECGSDGFWRIIC